MIPRIRPVRQAVNGFIGALVLLQNAFTQYLCGGILLLRWVRGNWGGLSGGFGSGPHRPAIIIAGDLGKLCQGFRPFTLNGFLIQGFFIDEFIVLRGHFVGEIVFLADG
jgi:hypothetical protein